MANFLRSYKLLPSILLKIILAEFFISLINAGFFMLYNFFLVDKSYSDSEIAYLLSFRFLLVAIASFLIGFYMKGRKLLPMFKVAAFLTPLLALGTLAATENRNDFGIILFLSLFGLSSSIMQIGVMPFIMRNTPRSLQGEAIALHFTTWSSSTFLMGITAYLVNYYFEKSIDVQHILYGLTGISAFAFFILLTVNHERVSSSKINFAFQNKKKIVKDSLRISNILFPSLLIGIGAGLTIPYLNLYFHFNFSMNFGDFALISAISTLGVTITSILVPHINKKYGYFVSIVLTQSTGIMALIGLSFCAYYQNYAVALYIAIGFFLIRQPAMNMAWPVISEFTMNYVGKENQEITSSMRSAVWTGSWFISSLIFKNLRSGEVSYSNIFLITSGIYIVGVIYLYCLVNSHQKNKCMEPHLNP